MYDYDSCSILKQLQSSLGQIELADSHSVTKEIRPIAHSLNNLKVCKSYLNPTWYLIKANY